MAAGMSASVARLKWIAWVLSGTVWFFWLGFEDRDTRSVLLLAALLLGAGILSLLLRSPAAAERSWLLQGAGYGLLAGLALAPLAVLLILLKIGLHAHPIPDFQPSEIQNLLSRIPGWAFSGLLLGSGLGLLAQLERGHR